MLIEWERPDGIPPLPTRGIQLWRLDSRLVSDEWIAGCEGLLAVDELERAERFRLAEGRREFVAARGLLRTLLGLATESEPSAIRFEVGRNGKPRLAEDRGIEFNVSHTHGAILIAISRGGSVGVDVERITERFADEAELMEMARNSFPAEIADAVKRAEGRQRGLAFFRAWTEREAVAKADGRGIASPLTYRMFEDDEGVETRVSLEIPAADGTVGGSVNYFVQIAELSGDCVGAVASVSPHQTLWRFDASSVWPGTQTKSGRVGRPSRRDGR
jgi:4'-phosphopantetheinyl transferase